MPALETPRHKDYQAANEILTAIFGEKWDQGLNLKMIRLKGRIARAIYQAYCEGRRHEAEINARKLN